MSRVGRYRLSEAGLAAIQGRLSKGRWASVAAFCNAVGIPRATYYELIRRKVLFEEPTIRDKLTSLGIPDTEQVGLYEYTESIAERPLSTRIGHHNLPAQPTSFIGREMEKATVKRLLAGSPMLTLTGAGGAGKTRLALQVASELLEDFPDGVRLLELAVLRAPDLIPRALLNALGIRGELGRSHIETVTAYLRSRTLLLIIDNCEHIVEACAQLAAILIRDCPKLKILATSRESRHIDGETVWRVPSLLLPDDASKLIAEAEQLEMFAEFDGISLFVERARAVRTDFVLTSQNVACIAEICRRLDGMPLATELAAARIRSMTIEDIQSRLDDRFRLLTKGNPTTLPRQQTLTALIDWSYSLLNRNEKALLARLSVFSGGWTLEAAERVCAGNEIEDCEVLDLLTSLVDKSLVVYDEREGKPPYRLLETIRIYAANALAASDENDAIRNNHHAYFVAVAVDSESRLESAQQDECLRRLKEDYENLRGALDHSLTADASEDGVRLCAALRTVWETLGYHSEGRVWCDRALATPPGRQNTRDRARVLDTAGVLASSQGDYESARAYLGESLAISREIGYRRGVASSLVGLGVAAISQGEFVCAREMFEESLVISRETGNCWDIGKALLNLGNLAEHQGDYASAQVYYEESLAVRRQIGDRRGIAYSLLNLGNVADCHGDYVLGRSYYEQSLAQFRGAGDRGGIATSLNYLGNAGLNLGNYATAKLLYEESASISREIGSRRTLAHAINNLGNVVYREGDYASARAHYEQSLTIRRDIGDRRGTAASLNGLGSVVNSMGDFASARALHEESLSLYEEIQDGGNAAFSHYCLGNVARAQGEYATAHKRYDKGLSLFWQCNDNGGTFHVLKAIATLAFEENNYLLAAQLWGSAEELRTKIGAWLTPSEQLSHDRDVAKARGSLGEEAFSAMWAVGRAMPLEKAIELSLGRS